MTDQLSYERDPYCTVIETLVLRVDEEDGRPYAVLADTILYPEGGGQPADRGTLNDVTVLDVQRRAGELRHQLAAPIVTGPVTVRLDWVLRFDHMQQHTAQHVLTAIAHERWGWATTAFHLGESVSDVELTAPRLNENELAALEDAVAAEIRAARPVTARRVSAAEYAQLKVRTRGLPDGHTGDIRLVEIAGVDLNTCGGTHVRSTAEIETVKLLSTEALRGGTRLFFVAGGRARRRLGEHEQRAAVLRARLGVPDQDVVAAVESRLAQLHADDKRARAIEQELAEALAETLAARPGSLVEQHFEGKDAAFLGHVARRLVAAAPAKAGLLTSTLGDQSFFVLAAGEDRSLDVRQAGAQIAAILGGRGGGSGRVFQGKVGRISARPQALARIDELVGR